MKNAIDKANGFCFGSREERTLRAMMSSALGGAEFEYGKTLDIRENIMEAGDVVERAGEREGAMMEEDEDPEALRRRDNRERLGNDLDQLDIGPGFQV